MSGATATGPRARVLAALEPYGWKATAERKQFGGWRIRVPRAELHQYGYLAYGKTAALAWAEAENSIGRHGVEELRKLAGFHEPSRKAGRRPRGSV